MDRYALIAITILFSHNITSGSDSKCKKIELQKKITQLTGFSVEVAHIVVTYLGFFKIVGMPSICYDIGHGDRAYSTCLTIKKDNRIQRSRIYHPLTPGTAFLKAFTSHFDLQKLSIIHTSNTEDVATDPTLEEIHKTNETTNEIRCIVGTEIVPDCPGTAALISSNRSKLVVFDPRCDNETLSGVSQWATASLPDEPNEFDPRIFVYSIRAHEKDKNFTNNHARTNSSCCSIS